MRNFRDAAGVDWTVYITIPSNASERRAQHLAEAYRSGWLVFECATEKRRFAPVPAEWAQLSDAGLEALCAAATPQPARRRATTHSAPLESAVTPPPEPAADILHSTEPLRRELQSVTTRLDATLDQVCEQRVDPDAGRRLDTGELIRVEETLAVAAEMAKEAVTLRRKLRGDASSVADRDQPRNGQHGHTG